MKSIKQRLLEIQAQSLATAETAKQLIAEIDDKKPVTDKQQRMAEIRAQMDANVTKNILKQLSPKKKAS